MRHDVGPKSNQLTAVGNSVHGLVADHSQGVETATAASTHAGLNEADEQRSGNHCSQSRSRTVCKKIIVQTDLVDQLNFEFMHNKNSMAVFMIRLRRVYRA
jgi:hypothetical protein